MIEKAGNISWFSSSNRFHDSLLNIANETNEFNKIDRSFVVSTNSTNIRCEFYRYGMSRQVTVGLVMLLQETGQSSMKCQPSHLCSGSDRMNINIPEKSMQRFSYQVDAVPS